MLEKLHVCRWPSNKPQNPIAPLPRRYAVATMSRSWGEMVWWFESMAPMRVARLSDILPWRNRLGGRHETSPPTISASGRGRCLAAGNLALGLGASLSDTAGAHHRAVRTSRRDGHYCAAHRAAYAKTNPGKIIFASPASAARRMSTASYSR